MTLAGGLVDRRVRALFQLGENMRFDEWKKTQDDQFLCTCARHVWEAAQKIEREACARVCEATMADSIIGGNPEYNTGREMGATVCANKIRMRSNA